MISLITWGVVSIVIAMGGQAIAMSPEAAAKAAEEAKKQFSKETTYKIGDGYAVVESIAKNNKSWDEKMDDFITDEVVRPAVAGLPYVTNVQVVPGKKIEDVNNEWSDYILKKRTSYVYVTLSLPARVTLLLKAEEEYRKCKSPEELKKIADEDDWDDDWDTKTSCKKESKVLLKGPMTTYGTFTSWFQVSNIMQGKQEISIELKQSYSGDNTELVTRFFIKSMHFEKSLFKYMEALNVKPHAAITSNLTRHHLLVGVSRIARQANERILK